MKVNNMNNFMGGASLEEMALEIREGFKRVKELQKPLREAARKSPEEYGNRAWVIIPPTQTR